MASACALARSSAGAIAIAGALATAPAMVPTLAKASVITLEDNCVFQMFWKNTKDTVYAV